MEFIAFLLWTALVFGLGAIWASEVGLDIRTRSYTAQLDKLANRN